MCVELPMRVPRTFLLSGFRSTATVKFRLSKPAEFAHDGGATEVQEAAGLMLEGASWEEN